MAYATLSQIRAYRGIGTGVNDDDGILADCLERASGAITRYCDRRFDAFATATRYYDAVRDVSPDRQTLYLDDDLCSITLITNGTDNAVTKYVPEPRNVTPYREIRLKRTAGEAFTWSDEPEDAIKVCGKWAYSATPPADIVQATIRLASYMYVQKDSSVFDVTAFPDAGVMTLPQGMPRDVRELLEPYRRIR